MELYCFWGTFFSFFLYLTSFFIYHVLCICFVPRTYIPFFSKYQTILFATYSSESYAHFPVFKRSFINLLKSFFVGFETFLTSGSLNSQTSHSKLTCYCFSQSKLQKKTEPSSSCFSLFKHFMWFERFFTQLVPDCILVTMSNDILFLKDMMRPAPLLLAHLHIMVKTWPFISFSCRRTA